MRRESGDGFLGDLGRGTSCVREAERDLRAARYYEPRLALSWSSLAVSPTMVGQSKCLFRVLSATVPEDDGSELTQRRSTARWKQWSAYDTRIRG
jgi:hypothetical protein